MAPHPHATSQEAPGEYRRHDIQAFPGGMEPPSHVLLAGEMRSWISSTRALEAGALDFPEKIAAVHCEFERIHPFIDGNGRAAAWCSTSSW